MTDRTVNDNQPPRAHGDLRGPDAHGQAAMLLVESLLHGLVERSVLTRIDALDIVATAAEVKEDLAQDMGDSRANMEKSLGLLGAIHASLGHDDLLNL